MSNVVIIVVALIVIVAIAAVVIWTTQRRRSEALRERFGPEYERAVEAARDKGAAEKELRERQERVEALDIRPLEVAARDRYAERWREVQAMFVDEPGSAVDQADALIGEVMRARGYPVGDFEQRAADISVNHPQVVDHYRTAHAIAVRRRAGEGATEQLRQAFVHYRALFAELLETTDTGATSEPAAAAGASAPEARLVERESAAGDARSEALREEVDLATGTTPTLDEVAQPAPTAEPTPSTDARTPADPARRA